MFSSSPLHHNIFKRHIYLHLYLYIYRSTTVSVIVQVISVLIAINTGMDPLKTTCFYFLFIVFVILSRTFLCDSRHLVPMEMKLGVNRDHLSVENNEEITKQGAPSTNETKTLLSEAPIEHTLANHGQINGKEDFRVKRASLDKTMPSERVSRTWKVPKYSKKQPSSDQEHPAFSLDYMQPSTHPPHHN